MDILSNTKEKKTKLLWSQQAINNINHLKQDNPYFGGPEENLMIVSKSSSMSSSLKLVLLFPMLVDFTLEGVSWLIVFISPNIL